MIMVRTGLPVFINVDQALRSTSGSSPCKNQRPKRICGCGGIGRLGGFRCCHLREAFSLSPPARKIKYAPVAKMVYAADLGSASLANRGSSPLGRTTKTVVSASEKLQNGCFRFFIDRLGRIRNLQKTAFYDIISKMST